MWDFVMKTIEHFKCKSCGCVCLLKALNWITFSFNLNRQKKVIKTNNQTRFFFKVNELKHTMALNGFLDFFQKGKVGSGLHLRSHNVYEIFFYFIYFFCVLNFLKYISHLHFELFNNRFNFLTDISTEKEIYSGNNSILAT